MTKSEIDILIVDDVPDNRRLLARMLKRRGYTVDTASDGLEAIEKNKAERNNHLSSDLNCDM